MRAVVLIVALLLAGCHKEPDFDERYTAAEKTIRAKAATMDAELAEHEKLASQAAAPPTTASAGAKR